MKYRTLLRTMTLLLALPGVAHAAEGDARLHELESLLNQPVYGASKFAQTAAEAPAAVTVLTAGDIRSFGWRTLAEVLDAVRGINVRDDRAYAYLDVRGFSRPGDYSSRVLLLIDGVRVNDNIYDSAPVGREFPLDVALIERVEFIPGPGSALYGSNAVFGVVNVVTRSVAGLRGGVATLSADSERGRKIQVTLGREFDAANLLLGASAENRPGRDRYYAEFDTPQTHDGVASGMDDETDRKLYARYMVGEWTLTGLSSERKKRLPAAGFGETFNDPRTRWTDRTSMADATWQRALNGHDTLWVHTGIGDYQWIGGYSYAPVSSGVSSAHGTWWSLETRWATRAWARQHLVLGFELQRNTRQSQRVVTLEPQASTDVDLHGTGQRVGLFVNDEITLASTLKLDLGLRLDRPSKASLQSTPRVALLWEAADGLMLKAMAGSAYREPNAYETQYEDTSAVANPNLKRETVRTKELALDWRANERLRVSSSLFDNRARDLIEQEVDADTGLLIYRNRGGARAQGLELEGDYFGEGGWRVRSSWTRQRVTADSGAVSNAPRSLLKLHATAPWPGRAVRLGLELQRVGERLTLRERALAPYVVANATLLYDPPGKAWSVAGTIYNLANVRFADPGGPEHIQDSLARDGRSVALRLALRF